MSQPRLEGLYVGKPRVITDDRGEWTTSIGRVAAAGPLLAAVDGLPGDGVVYKTHGGPDRALLAYAAAHYAAWRVEAPGFAFPPPSFGENLLVAGLDETTVAIGDVWRVGGALVQVTQPRSPCANIARFAGLPDLLARVVAKGRMGWLLRVLEPGPIAAGDGVEVVERPHAEWTVARVFEADRGLRAKQPQAIAESRAIAALPPLAAAWREGIEKRLAAGAGAL